MGLDAVKAKTNVPIQSIRAKEQKNARALENENLKPETKKPVETMIFANKSNYMQAAPKLTSLFKPIAENSQAAATSEKPAQPIFTFNNEGRYVAASVHNPSGSVNALASALTGAESNNGSGDKKDQQGNTFLSAHKSLKDTRFEALNDDNIINIMKGIC